MRAILLLVAAVLLSSSVAHAASTYSVRGYLLSRNVPVNGVTGALNLDGYGEVAITYFTVSQEIGVYMSHSFGSHGTPQEAVLVVNGSSINLGTPASSPFYVFVSNPFTTSAQRTAFGQALTDGTAYVQFGSSSYPNGVARANLNNFDPLGSRYISFHTLLSGNNVAPDGVTTTAAGAVQLTYNSDTFEITNNIQIYGIAKGNQVSSVQFINTIDNSIIYSYSFSQPIGHVIELALINSIGWFALYSESCMVIVSTTANPSGELAGILVHNN